MNLPAQIQEKLNQRQTQAIIVGALILVLVAVLQLVHSRNSQPLVALLESQQHLNEKDMERMEFAIAKSGISGCKVDNGILMVPRNRKEDCLNAIAENNALPEFLRSEAESEPSVNPFLSRSQQKQIEDARKKRLIREMVMRLPFVSNAWFEMDRASSGTAFKPAQQTAVISVEPPADILLDPGQVATIREMIAGAIAGLPGENIRVIDITSGYAYKTEDAGQVAIEQREPYEQETYYRRRIQQAIEAWGDIDVQVSVDKIKVPVVAKPVRYTKPIEVEPVQRTVSVIGTNGSASINDMQIAKVSAPVVVEPEPEPEPVYVSRVDVVLQVPESAAAQMSTGKSSFSIHDRPGAKQQAINKLGQTLVQTVKPILPDKSFEQGTPFPISVQFIPSPVAAPVAVVDWRTKVRAFVTEHWPSAVVLSAGLLLITLMTRYSTHHDDYDDDVNEDIISINTATTDVAASPSDKSLPEVAISQTEERARREAEEKLGSIVENDPESAARVIESWIRNAG